MVWLIALPSGLLSYRVIEHIFNSTKYMDLLKEMIIPIIKLNMRTDFYFQQDNSPVHTAKIVKEFFTTSQIEVLQWPAYSPDINIVEDIWKTISDTVYDGNTFTIKYNLEVAISNCIHGINSSKRHLVLDLYKNIRSKLCIIMRKNGNLYNK